MTGLTLQTMLSQYEQYFIDYLILIDSFGTVSNGVRTLPQTDASSNVPIAYTAATQPTDASGCWTTCSQTSGCILSSYDTTGPVCSLYGAPTSGTYLNYVSPLSTFTTMVENQEYYYYNVLKANSNLQAYTEDIQNYITAQGYDGQQMAAIHSVVATLTTNGEKLKQDRALILKSLTKFQNTYDETYTETKSKDTLLQIWVVVAFFSFIIAIVLCNAIIKKKKNKKLLKTIFINLFIVMLFNFFHCVNIPTSN